MKTFARIASTLVAAFALTFPVLSMAEVAPVPAAAKESKAKAHFPMDAATFKTHIATKMAKKRAKIEAKMDKHAIPETKRAEVRKSLDEAKTKIAAAVDKAAKDGVVTKEEAKQVRKISKEVHKALIEKLGLKKKEHKNKGSNV